MRAVAGGQVERRADLEPEPAEPRNRDARNQVDKREHPDFPRW